MGEKRVAWNHYTAERMQNGQSAKRSPRNICENEPSGKYQSEILIILKFFPFWLISFFVVVVNILINPQRTWHQETDSSPITESTPRSTGESRERISRHRTTGEADPSQFSPSPVAKPAQAVNELLKLVYTDPAPWTSHRVGDGFSHTSLLMPTCSHSSASLEPKKFLTSDHIF